MADAAPTAAAGAVDAGPLRWLFLVDWFRRLDQAGVNQSIVYRMTNHDIRVDDDGPEDEVAWLQIGIRRRYLTNDPEYDDEDEYEEADYRWASEPPVPQQLGLLRDALILTSLVAKIDYHGWFAMMTKYTSMEVARRHKFPVDRVAPKIPVQFEFHIGECHSLGFLEWSSSLGHLLGNLKRSDQYARDLDVVKREMVDSGLSWLDMEPTPIRLDVDYASSQRHSYQDLSRRLTRVVDAIHHTQRLEQAAQDEGNSRGDLFHVADISAFLRDAPLHDTLVEAMTNLLQAGVRVSSLHLPDLGEHLPSVHVWCPFVRLLTGVDVDVEGRLASVRHIMVPGSYATRHYFALFCSALVYAKGVDKLSIMCNSRPNLFGAGVSQRHFSWRWLSFALWSRVSSTSVKKLCIRGEGPMSWDIPAIRGIVDSEEPFHVLSNSAAKYDTDYPTLMPSSATSLITIRPRAIFRVSDGRSAFECHSISTLAGELLSEPTDAGERVAFIPGYGLCQGQLSSRPEKRSKTQQTIGRSASSFASLVIEPSDRGSVDARGFMDLLDVIKVRLRELTVPIRVNDDILGAILHDCPRLESIRFKKLRLSSMDALANAYANGAQLSSIAADDAQIPTDSLNAFWRQLAVKNPAKGSVAYTLERFSCHVHQADPAKEDESIRLVEHMLKTNTILTHLHSVHEFRTRRSVGEYNGQRIPGVSHAQKRQLLAFLSAMRSIAQANPALELDGHVKGLIWELAVEPRYRHVLWFGMNIYQFRF